MNNGIRFVKYAVLILYLSLSYSGAFAYEVCTSDFAPYKELKWQNSNATYYINTSGGPSGSLSAIEAGMQTWTEVGSSDFSFIPGGTTTSTAHETYDSTNIATFGLLEVGTVAENAYWYNTVTGELLDSDIRFNTYYTWTTNGSGDYDVQNVGAHEYGHSLCLKDLYNSADSEKTMYGYVSSGETKKQTLDQDDIDGITYIYTCPNLSARIVDLPPVYYSAFQVVYDNAGDGDTIQSHTVVFSEDIYIDHNKSVVHEGGFNCDYNDPPIGRTTLNGNMIISAGSLTIAGGAFKVQ
ncbi:MAG: matrixin family metalloprotease [Nitrospira sp.]|nr:matrixin family metalloprotease [Nitrospira sp.]